MFIQYFIFYLLKNLINLLIIIINFLLLVKSLCKKNFINQYASLYICRIFLIKILIKMYEMYYNNRFFRKKLKKIWFLSDFSEKNSK